MILLVILGGMGAVFAVAARRETARDRVRRDRIRAGGNPAAGPKTNGRPF